VGSGSKALHAYDERLSGDARVPIRSLPGLIREGLQLAWAAGKLQLATLIAVQVVNGLGVFLDLLLGRIALQELLRAVKEHESFPEVFLPIIAVGVVTAALLIARATLINRQQILGELVVRFVERRILEVTSSVDLTLFETADFHNRVQRIRIQAGQPLTFAAGLTGLAGAAIGGIGVLSALAIIQPVLLAVILGGSIPAAIVASRSGGSLWTFNWRITPQDRKRQYIFSLLVGRQEAKEVRAFGTGSLLRSKYKLLCDERLMELRVNLKRQFRISLVANGIIGATLTATMLLIAWLATSGRVTIAEVAVAVAGSILAGNTISQAASSVGSLAQSALFLEDYRALLDLATVTNTDSTRSALKAPSGFNVLRVDNLSFSYPTSTRPTLTNISMEIRSGEVIALVGESGSGKTTLAKLLAGLYSPDSGTILWDGRDVRSFDPDDLRRSVAVIFEDYLRYQLPATENIGFGRPEAVDDVAGIRAAARQADADVFVSGLAYGYDTLLGPQFWGGTDLSCGQWQRLALARAFFRNAPFVILDEPTSALDARSEHDLFQRIGGLLAGRTVLLISHRFSTVRSATRIFVLKDGQVVESGTHDELVRAHGLYAELFALQAASYNGEQTVARPT
jgi:ATP-binding cassette, subfamily B, bacterial